MDRKFIQDLAQRTIGLQKKGDDLLERQEEEGCAHWQELAQHRQVLLHSLNVTELELNRFKVFAPSQQNPQMGQAQNVQKLAKP